jgi:two-component system alkaline phosphatase synthesis response regulator PhoP
MRTILVVEDELSIVEFLKDALEGEGYKVETANNGVEGLACLSNASVDLILCDVMMPIMDGREMCRIVQSDPSYGSLPIILMSAVVTVLNDIACHAAAFIKKPFNLSDLLDTINAIASANGAT